MGGGSYERRRHLIRNSRIGPAWPNNPGMLEYAKTKILWHLLQTYEERMGNLVVCCDGTSNEFSQCNTNVVILYRMLARNSPGKQICFYVPGVGTFAFEGALLPISQRVTRLLGLAINFGLSTSIRDGYTFLMTTGNRVMTYIFSFSAVEPILPGRSPP